MRGTMPLRYLLPGLLIALAVACGGDESSAVEPIGFGELREFPKELESSSPQLEPDRAAEIAREFVSGTRIALYDKAIIDVCADGTGRYVLYSASFIQGETFTWEALAIPGGVWNEPGLIATMDDPDKRVLHGGTYTFVMKPAIDGKIPSWSPASPTGETKVFDNPTCGQ